MTFQHCDEVIINTPVDTVGRKIVLGTTTNRGREIEYGELWNDIEFDCGAVILEDYSTVVTDHTRETTGQIVRKVSDAHYLISILVTYPDATFSDKNYIIRQANQLTLKTRIEA
jgi:hypothetical protein